MRYFIWLLFPIILFAHPHVFIEAHVSVEEDKTWIVWSFDEMSSSLLMSDYDKNKNNVLEENEIAFLKKDHFDALAPYSYFVHLADSKSDEEKPFTRVEDFTATFEDHKLVYLFSIPTPKLKTYELRFYDGEMYVAMILKPEFITCKAPVQCRVEGYDADFYYGYKLAITR